MPSRDETWKTNPVLWPKLKPLARQMRRQPTPAERRLWQHVRNRQLKGVRFRRQHTIERFIVDFYVADLALVVEVDGAVHQYTPEEDAVRQEFLESMSLRVVRFTNDDVMKNLSGVMDHLAAVIEEMQTSP